MPFHGNKVLHLKDLKTGYVDIFLTLSAIEFSLIPLLNRFLQGSSEVLHSRVVILCQSKNVNSNRPIISRHSPTRLARWPHEQHFRQLELQSEFRRRSLNQRKRGDHDPKIDSRQHDKNGSIFRILHLQRNM